MRRLAIGLLCMVACSKAGEESSVKRAPIGPPPPEIEIPDDLSIPVAVDGKPAAPITRATLEKTEPHYEDTERRAWRLVELIPAFGPGATLRVEGRGGLSISLEPPGSDDEPQPVLFLTRRGDVVAAMVSPEEPFPPYHGSGGRLRRPGDPRPRLSPVLGLRVSRPAAGGGREAPATREKAAREALAGLEVSVDGGPGLALDARRLVALEPVEVKGDTGETRAAWSLRAVAALLDGGGRVVAVRAGDDEVEIAAADWDDQARLPVLRANRDGVLKFQWLGADGRPTGDAQLRGVTALRLKSSD